MSQNQTTEQKKEFNMKQVFVMWIRKSKTGKQYVTGRDAAGERLVGFFNGKKKNPKEPDVRIYRVDQDGHTEQDEFTSLWMNVSKNNKKYLTGKVAGQRVVGFINSKATTTSKTPYFTVYESESEPPKKEETSSDGFMNIPDGLDEELPFS